MKRVELCLIPVLYPLREIVEGHTTVVVDVLRATTSICTAFEAGAAEVVPLDSLDSLPRYKSLGYTLAAERNAQKVMGAECGNSPTEYMSMNLKGKRLAYSTTNGTVGLIKASADSEKVVAGCFANLSAVVRFLSHDSRDLVILCSGWLGGVSIEDTLFAGCLVERLKDYVPANDAAHLAVAAYQQANDDLYGYCQRGSHIKRLQRMNYDRDIRFALEIDTCHALPTMTFADGQWTMVNGLDTCNL